LNDNYGSLGHGQFWIDVLSVQKSASYTHSNGSSIKYSNWTPGEPRACKSECCAVTISQTGSWTSRNCSDSYNVLCETDYKPSIAESSISKDGFKRGPFGKEYLYHIHHLWHEEAETVCNSYNGANLVSIGSYSEHRWIVNHVYSGEFWTAGRYRVGYGWRWSNNKPLTYTDWHHRSECGHQPDCCILMLTRKDDFKFYKGWCRVSKRFVCERYISQDGFDLNFTRTAMINLMSVSQSLEHDLKNIRTSIENNQSLIQQRMISISNQTETLMNENKKIDDDISKNLKLVEQISAQVKIIENKSFHLNTIGSLQLLLIVTVIGVIFIYTKLVVKKENANAVNNSNHRQVAKK